MSAIEVVFFDVGGTLLEVSPSIGHVYARACASRGASVTPEALQEGFDHAWVSLSSLIPRGVDRYRHFPGGEREWWHRVTRHALDRCGVANEHRPPHEEMRDFFARADSWRVYPETRETLGRLDESGFRLGVISNWDSRLPQLLERLQLHDHFERIVYSASVGREKPHRDIFDKALAEMNVEPHRAVHIGDRLDDDYMGARNAGMRAILLEREPGRAKLREEVRRCGDTRDLVVDLREALGRIGESAGGSGTAPAGI